MRLTRAVTCDLEVPAEAELVLEGFIDPREDLVLEGPFGDHTGFYSLAARNPKVPITAVTMRSEPIWPHTIVGRPPMEDYWLGHATERIFLPLLRLTLPEVVDSHMPAEGIFHNLVFVSIDKQYPGHAFKVMNGLWGQGLMSLAKVIVVLDRDVNVRDTREAWWVALNNIDPERDVRFTLGPMDVLDHSSRGFTFGSKMGVDATKKWPGEGARRTLVQQAGPRGEAAVPLGIEVDHGCREAGARTRAAPHGESADPPRCQLGGESAVLEHDTPRSIARALRSPFLRPQDNARTDPAFARRARTRRETAPRRPEGPLFRDVRR